MTGRRYLSRRRLTKQMGLVAGVSLLPPVVAGASIATPEQVEGPFYPVHRQHDLDTDLTHVTGRTQRAEGEVTLVRGRVLASSGGPLQGALVDVWQANHHGRYSHSRDRNTSALDPNFQGWAMMSTSAEGRYGFRTIKPGAYPLAALGGDGWRCRHIHFKVSKPGSTPLTTQMYFFGDPLIEHDLEIRKAPAELRDLLISRKTEDEDSGLPLFEFDIVLDDV